jgi:hypothetical protein
MGDRQTTKSGREVFKAMRPIIEAAGATCWLEPPSGRGHFRLIIELHGKKRFTPISGTPRRLDQSIKQKTSDVHRLLRELQGA